MYVILNLSGQYRDTCNRGITVFYKDGLATGKREPVWLKIPLRS
jgi:hypothetical protein